jgi:hypothetical protein
VPVIELAIPFAPAPALDFAAPPLEVTVVPVHAIELSAPAAF